MNRRLVIAAVAAALILLAIGFVRCNQNRTVRVTTGEVVRGPLSVSVSTNGRIEPVEEAAIRARLDGRVVEIPEPGERVAAGELLLQIDPGPVSSELAAAESARLEALSSLQAARDAVARIRRRATADQDLFDQGGITGEQRALSKAELDEASAHLAFLERDVPVRVDSLDHRIRDLEARREASEVRARFDGTVYRADAKSGETVRVGQPVLWFADLEALRVRINVDQVDLGRVDTGQTVLLTANAYPDRRWRAQISEIIPNMVRREGRLVAEALATVEAPVEGLVPGMKVDVEIRTEWAEDAIQIPAQAVFSDAQGSYVYRLDGRRARLQRVEIGLASVDAVEITEGLEPGALVVVGPAPEIGDGVRVVAHDRENGSSR